MGAALEVDEQGRGTLWANASMAPHVSAREVWGRWRERLPDTSGQWAALPAGERDGWVEAAQLHYFHQAGERRAWPMPEGRITLHGEHVVDLASFFCAVGEAFNGPGGYFGSNLTALADCLANLDREPGQPVRLQWTDIAVAEQGLARRVETSGGWKPIFDLVMEVLDQYNVEVLRR
ncbi:barstar family protein [Catenulispora yoronensis]